VNFISTLRRFVNLPGPDRAAVLSAGVVLLATFVALRLLGFRRWQNFLRQRTALPAVTAADFARPQAQHLARLACSAAQHLFLRTNCLERAMTVQFLLRRRGLPAELHFGARKAAARLEAHAWVVCYGVALNEDQGEHRHFLPFAGQNALMETLRD
jgi:hypothetical protein